MTIHQSEAVSFLIGITGTQLKTIEQVNPTQDSQYLKTMLVIAESALSDKTKISPQIAYTAYRIQERATARLRELQNDDLRKNRTYSGAVGNTKCIYLIHSHDDVYKIGKTNDLMSRFTSHQSSSPYELTLICQILTDEMGKLEHELHVKFKHRRIRGEWFRLSTSDVIYIKGLAS